MTERRMQAHPAWPERLLERIDRHARPAGWTLIAFAVLYYGAHVLIALGAGS